VHDKSKGRQLVRKLHYQLSVSLPTTRHLKQHTMQPDYAHTPTNLS
jgi:hypothetical protein